MRKKLINFLKSPAGRRFIIWAIPLVVSFVSKRLSKKKSKSASRR